MRIILAITGASGVIYGIRLLEQLNKATVETHLVMSEAAKKTMRLETAVSPEELAGQANFSYGNDDLAAPPASGSFLYHGMVVAPCSMKTLSAIAHGYANSLITRAADVTIKERRKLILLVRETPLSPIHLENMLKLAKLGVVIMPPVPAFYHRPQTIEDLVTQMIGRVMDHLGIDNNLMKRWPESLK
ncbi:MAG: UbiX family flavin prenyltransferase [Bacillota bacterium]